MPTIKKATPKLIDAWIETKKELSRLEEIGEGSSKIAIQVQSRLIALWNKLPPQQQKEIAIKYSI